MKLPNETPLTNMNTDKLLAEGAALLLKHQLFHWRLELKKHTGSRLGSCDYKVFIIVLNGFYVANHSEEMVLDTLRHEVAHALTPGHQHDNVWKAMAVQLGCRPEAHWKTGIILNPGKYKAVCPSCQVTFYKYRKPRYLHLKGAYYCPECGEEDGAFNFQRNETPL